MRASLSVEIQPGGNKGVYKVQASSNDGRTPYEGFASAIGITLHELDSVSGKDPVDLGTYQVRSNAVTVEFNPSTDILTLNGVPLQELSNLCCQRRYVGQLTLGRYQDPTGRFKMKRKAEQAGIKVKD